MAKRLVKIAKELNVGTSTIVEFLSKNGFDLENKPTAKVSDEMEKALVEEFRASISIKEKADKLNIRFNSPQKKEPKLTFGLPKATPKMPPPIISTPPPPVVAKEEPVVVVTPTPPSVVEEEKVMEKPKVEKRGGLKVLGKINLDNVGKKKPKKEVKEIVPPVIEKKVETPVVKSKVEKPKEEKKEISTPPVVEVKVKTPEVKVEKPKAKVEEKKEEKKGIPAPPVVESKVKTPEVKKAEPKSKAKAEEKKVVPTIEKKEKSSKAKEVKGETPAKTEVPDETASPEPEANKSFRAKTPQLEGLKIKGKINLSKFSPKPKPKKKRDDRSSNNRSGDKKTQGSGSGGSDKNKKKDDGTAKKKTRVRTRKVVAKKTIEGSKRTVTPARGRRGARGGKKEDEVTEVSKKQIEDRIKATKARLSGGGNKRQKTRRDNRAKKKEVREQKEVETKDERLQVTEFISVSEIANLMDVNPTQVIMSCMNLGYFVTLNQRLEADIIDVVASEFGHEVIFVDAEDAMEEEEAIVDDPADLVSRAPIVTVMGHVDHGKTSLLDYVRKANVADSEAGGITQHIGAYEVYVGEDRKKVTFLDTPGHEAFTAMRARGAKVTDVAIIIISADDRIMPQTKEAISHAQAADVPMIFAINKIDKPGADPERIKGELAGMNLQVEDWGGKYQSQDISAKHGTNIEELLEKILLEAELLELKANPKRAAQGVILEASLDKGKGYVTKALIQTGTLNIGDPIVSGEHSGKVKAMFNEKGQRIKVAGPSTPVLVLGLSGAPQAGEKFKETESEQEARAVAQKRAILAREQANRTTRRVSLGDLGRRLALGSFKELNLIVKGDVDGSVEALSDSLLKQSHETVQINVIHKGVGQIIESDIMLAAASDAIVIGFQVRPSAGARRLAEKEGVQVKMYSIIYQAIEEVRAAIEGMLEPTEEEKIICEVEVREVYKINRVGTIAGCYVNSGKIARNSKIRLIRDGVVIYPTKENKIGELGSLKRFKDDAKDVAKNMECGLTIKGYNDIKEGDIIEGYEIIEIKQKL
ncbi:MAG: translation initiation factor IF-2 [Maribacter sp.]|jgi:translation initiation factor IF-2